MDLETIITTFIDKQAPKFAEEAVKLYKKCHQESANIEEFKEELTELFFDYAALVMAQVLAYLRDEEECGVRKRVNGGVITLSATNSSVMVPQPSW